ncbi:hypothetical protein LINPERHAP1_LOCUS16903, partial [Linum perenne]
LFPSLNLFSARKRFFCIHSLNLIESCDCAVRGVRRSRVFASPLHIIRYQYVRNTSRLMSIISGIWSTPVMSIYSTCLLRIK